MTRTASTGKILVVDDHSGFRSFVRALLESAAYDVIEAETADEALAALEPALRLVILDVAMAPTSGYELCRSLRTVASRLPLLFVSGERTEALDRVAGLTIGADDYLVKPVEPGELLARVQALLRRSLPQRARTSLTRRELEVLHLLADGFAQRDIAEQLVISHRTVGTHIEHILAKLGVRSRTQAVAMAFRQNLVEA